MLLRTAVMDDLKNLAGIYRRSSLSNPGDRDILLAHSESLEYSDIGVQEERTRVASDADDLIIGFASFRILRNAIELEDLFVDPPFMRQGVGRALVLDIVALARNCLFEVVEVTANPHALSFYEALGFSTARMVQTEFYDAPRMSRRVLD